MHKNRRYSTGIVMLLVLMLASGLSSFGQTYNNEWINYNNTYYKFKIGKDSLYRIPVTTLALRGLDTVPVQFLKMYRNGKEVPIYTSVSTGTLPADGYIEFWGLANDGEADAPLYREARNQHTTKYSLHSDTSVYFLTVDRNAINRRFNEVSNNVAGNTLPVEPYFIHKYSRYFHDKINPGFAADLEQYVYSSSYDRGEFWSSNDILQRVTRTEAVSGLFPYAGGPDANIRFGAFGNTVKTRRVKFDFNNTTIVDTALNFFSDMVTSVNFPSSQVTAASNIFAFTNVQPPKPPTGADPYTDRFVISFYELTYPRQFDFGNARRFYFELDPRVAGHYLEIRGFATGTGVPVLYDLENDERYVANTQVNGVLRFALTPSTRKRRLMLVSQASTFYSQISQLEEKKFIDLSNTTQQGNYLIISNPKLFNGTAGNNPVEDYRAYRGSTAGGSYNAKVYDINELTDQFAYGIKGHPLAVKNFIQFALANFNPLPSYVFLIGKGVNYTEYKFRSGPTFVEQARLNELNLVPVYGYPGSDNMFGSASATNPVTRLPIGRLSVVYPSEVENYLEKMKEYETAQKTALNTQEERLWMKNILHVTGASNALLGSQLCNYMHNYQDLVEDTLTGAHVTVLCKGSTGEVNQANSETVHRLFQEGLSLLTYFGHSSATTLEFNIENPEAYNNTGKYPVFSVNGCYAGDLFAYSVQRFSELETLSERFTLAKKKGGIAFIASTHFGVLNYLSVYLNQFYDKMAKTDYGASLGKLTSDALRGMTESYTTMDFLARAHAEQITLHGDPALYMNFQPKADYSIESSNITVDPTFISVSDLEFKVKIQYFNMGKATGDSVDVEVKRILPNGTSLTVFTGKRPKVNYTDSLTFALPIAALTDKGENKIIVTIDGNNLLDEMDEGNNSVTKSFFIYEDEATPVFPYNYSIVSDPAQKLYASTADPFAGSKQYKMQIDTSAMFNSPLNKEVTITARGGLLEFDPQVTYVDSIVYYWRTALVPPSGNDYIWNESSFMFRSAQQYGFNQSHFYQHTHSKNVNIAVDTPSRNWIYTQKANDLYVRQATYPTASGAQADFSISVNNGEPFGAGCAYNELIIHVFDKNTFKVWANDFSGATGLYDSYKATCGSGRENNFEYLLNTAAWRKRAMDFLDLIPDGSYVLVRNNGDPNTAGNTYPNVWLADTALYGSGNSLYHRLYDQGFTTLDSINRPRAWAFIYKKNSKSSFTPVTRISINQNDKLAFGVNTPTPHVNGTVVSPVFGPAKAWHNLVWGGRELETAGDDVVKLTLVGIGPDLSESVIRELGVSDRNVDISDVDVNAFPYLKLKLESTDSLRATPYQLDFWRLTYDPVPEGALAPSLFFTTRDSVELGAKVNFGIAFKNVSKVAFDSISVKVILTDKDNIQHRLDSLLKPIVVNDTVQFRYEIDTKNYPGQNTLFVEFNPMDKHQPEQHQFNNFLYRNLYVGSDRTKPLMDVTFDNVHILNGDIVSAKPHIRINLKDESKFLLLKDTSLISIKVKYPDGTTRTYRYDNDTVRFTPASGSGDNTASIDFYPSFLQTYSEDGMDPYELIVTGKDASNNQAGENGYIVNFMVINKPMISNLLNYPNPFTTSTAFVFTITGSEVPTNFKIQIMTVTGKIVREITGDELGPLRVGRNITEFKWDGTDQYGQRLANGVYLYRVISTLHGKKMDKFKAVGDNTDKYFSKGYGKMYLMR